MIYYAHVNEDNQVEREAMGLRAYSECYAIGGSGERVIALMDHPGLEKVHIIDNNPEALYLCELKIAALTCLSVEDYLSFIGLHAGAGSRVLQLKSFEAKLSRDCRQYWAQKPALIEKGVCFCGHFEQFLLRANPLVRLFMGKGFYQCFTTPKAQWKNFPHLRWGVVKAVFSKIWAYKALGMKDSAFVSKDSNLRVITHALQRSMDEDACQKSCLFYLVFKGNLDGMPAAFLPPSFQTSILERIKTQLEQQKLEISYHCGDLLEILEGMRLDTVATRFFSISDILSFADFQYLKAVIRCVENIKGGYRGLVFRAFVRNRLSESRRLEFQKAFGTLTDLSERERTNFYQAFFIEWK